MNNIIDMVLSASLELLLLLSGLCSLLFFASFFLSFFQRFVREKKNENRIGWGLFLYIGCM
jgi:hypothetical protein